LKALHESRMQRAGLPVTSGASRSPEIAQAQARAAVRAVAQDAARRSIQASLEQYRRNQALKRRRDTCPSGAPARRIWTLADLTAKQAADAEESSRFMADIPTSGDPSTGGVHTIENTFMTPEAIGREALRLTNAFRSQQRLPPLQWNQAMAKIGAGHSKNMGDGKVAKAPLAVSAYCSYCVIQVSFGHDGFHGRCERFPFTYHTAAENVAMNAGTADVAKAAVNGWITSPGHRRNLLGHFSMCGIGVYRNMRGEWYLTQLFVG